MNYDQKKLLEHYELDFGLRLVARFKFDPKQLWADPNLTTVPSIALYQTAGEDPLRVIADEVMSAPPKP